MNNCRHVHVHGYVHLRSGGGVRWHISHPPRVATLLAVGCSSHLDRRCMDCSHAQAHVAAALDVGGDGDDCHCDVVVVVVAADGRSSAQIVRFWWANNVTWRTLVDGRRMDCLRGVVTRYAFRSARDATVRCS